MAREIRVGRDTLRFVYDSHSEGGCYCPAILVFRRGPNGSPAGVGPKGFPTFLNFLRSERRWDREFRGEVRQGWNGTLKLYLPHLSFMRARKLRRLGGLKLYTLMYRLYNRKGG